MSRWAIIRGGVVENVVIWDGDAATWQPPEGCEVVPATDDAEIGGTWNGTKFQRPVRIEAEPAPDLVDVLLEKLVASKALSKKDADDIKAKK